ncbi:MAG: hypothetical protein Fur0042_05000 [Cyanophyceae cyanobacterium]
MRMALGSIFLLMAISCTWGGRWLVMARRRSPMGEGGTSSNFADILVGDRIGNVLELGSPGARAGVIGGGGWW